MDFSLKAARISGEHLLHDAEEGPVSVARRPVADDGPPGDADHNVDRNRPENAGGQQRKRVFGGVRQNPVVNDQDGDRQSRGHQVGDERGKHDRRRRGTGNPFDILGETLFAPAHSVVLVTPLSREVIPQNI
ncbi:MAG: hypothetical protein ACMVO3_17935 [Thalassobaculum sp.]